MRSGKSGRPSRPKSLLYDTWFQFRARWHDAAGLLEGCSGKERSIAWAGRFRQQAAARAARLAPGGPAVVPPTSYARGEVVRVGAKLAKQRAAPRTGVERARRRSRPPLSGSRGCRLSAWPRCRRCRAAPEPRCRRACSRSRARIPRANSVPAISSRFSPMMPVTHRRKRRLFVVSEFLPQRSKALLTSG